MHFFEWVAAPPKLPYNLWVTAKPHPLIIALIADLFFTSRLESTAAALGYSVHLIEHTGQVGSTGQGFIDFLLERQPALVIVDLNNTAVPWESWITAAKAAPQTAAIPVIAFGSHKAVDLMARAQQTGADAVLAKSRFTQALPELIEQYIQIK
ncbi:MAG: hypothetical protein OEZ02_09725 [Anaerolineae bacterium]|nr:hypothetical protein [Anaerolineae bacterium]